MTNEKHIPTVMIGDDKKRLHAVEIYCAGPSEFVVPEDGELSITDDSFETSTGVSLNGGVVLKFNRFCGEMGIPKNVPFAIYSSDPVSGFFASPGHIEAYDGGVVAVIDQRLAIAARSTRDLFIGDEKIEQDAPLFNDPEEEEIERRVKYETDPGLLQRVKNPIRYDIKSPNFRKEGGIYRCDRRFPPLPDILVRCAMYKAVFIDGDAVYLSQRELPEGIKGTPEEDVSALLRLVREHVRA